MVASAAKWSIVGRSLPDPGYRNPQLQGRHDFRLSTSAYDNTATCYDREYLFQWGEMDPKIHRQAEEQVRAAQAVSTTAPAPLNVRTEPYHPSYFVINGRSMPDDMDANYAPNYPNQPYNGNPHMHPGDLVLIRVIGQGRFQHPFHEHGNHVRILGRDGNLILIDEVRLGVVDACSGLKMLVTFAAFSAGAVARRLGVTQAHARELEARGLEHLAREGSLAAWRSAA